MLTFVCTWKFHHHHAVCGHVEGPALTILAGSGTTSTTGVSMLVCWGWRGEWARHLHPASPELLVRAHFEKKLERDSPFHLPILAASALSKEVSLRQTVVEKMSAGVSAGAAWKRKETIPVARESIQPVNPNLLSHLVTFLRQHIREWSIGQPY